RAGGERGHGHVAADRGQPCVDEVAATVGDAPGHGQQRRGRVRRVGVDQQVVLVRRRPGCVVWVGQGGVRDGRDLAWNAVCTAAQPGAGAGASILARASGPQVPCPRPIPIVPRLARGHRTRLSHLRLSGSITALATPFTLAGELDLDAWRRLLLAQLSGGTGALVVAGSTGGAASLRDAEYEALLRTAVEVAGGRVPVLAGTGHTATARTIEATRRAAA